VSNDDARRAAGAVRDRVVVSGRLERIAADLVEMAKRLERLQSELAAVVAATGGAEERPLGPLEEVLDVVCGHYQVTRATVLLAKRGRLREVWPRHVALYLFRRATGWSLAEMGVLFRRDHGTVMHSLKAVKNRMETEPQFRAEVSMLEARLCRGHAAIKPPKPKIRAGNRHVPDPETKDHRREQRQWASCS
jgi:chromosomal replication initiation ATPase DnaA